MHSRQCLGCGSTFETRRIVKTYCSLGCYSAVQSTLMRKKAMLTCEGCGKLFYPRRRTADKDSNRFCSRTCAGAARIDNSWIHWWFASCVICQQRFIKPMKSSVVCGRRECQLEHGRREGRRKHIPVLTIRPCADGCGNEISGTGRKYCLECATARAAKFHRETKNPRDRARRVNSPYAHVPKSAVIDRWGQRCWICRERIDMAAKAPSPKSYSVDHFVPLSLGGWHDLPNLRPAHFQCNSLRGASFTGQLMLTSMESER